MSERVWQLELRREAAQVSVTLREVRLPRPIAVRYPRDPFALAEEWTRRAAVLVALSAGDPVGYLCLEEQPVSFLAVVTDLAVAPEYRRRGVGSALLQAAQEWAQGRGGRRIMIAMQAKNEAAIRLAQKFGFEFCGYNDQYYVTQDVTLFFCRSLR